MKKERVAGFCGEILRRRIEFKWECLGRVESIDDNTARAMKSAGCDRIYFGIESGNDSVLKEMNKNITVSAARRAVEAAHGAGIKAGAFFILFYPGETDATVLNTLRFAMSLPLDYASFTAPYPIPGTALHEKMKGRNIREWKQPEGPVSAHRLIFDADFSEAKIKFGIMKGAVEFLVKKYLGNPAMKLVEKPTDLILKMMR